MSNTNNNLQTQTSSILHNDTVSSYSTSKVQEKTQLSRSRCMNSLREINSQFKFLTETLQDFGTMPIFKRTFSQDLDLLEQHLTKDIFSQTDCNTSLTKLKTKFEHAFNLEFKKRMQKDTRFNAQSFQDAMICNMDSIEKYMLEIILHQQRTPQLLKQKKLMQTQGDYSKCILSKEDLKGTRIEHGFKRAFMSLFGQDVDIFTSTMLFDVEQLQKQLDKDKFQEDGSMAAFWVYFAEYTRIEVKPFIDTLIQHMGNVKKFIAERTRHQRQYDRRVNKRQMQTQESKVDTGKAIDADLVITESSGT
ncbi:hypothetical protein Tco_0721405 [Tanacetum coccineum]